MEATVIAEEIIKRSFEDRDRGQQLLVPHVKPPPAGAVNEVAEDLAAKTESCFSVFFCHNGGRPAFLTPPIWKRVVQNYIRSLYIYTHKTA